MRERKIHKVYIYLQESQSSRAVKSTAAAAEEAVAAAAEGGGLPDEPRLL